MMSKWTKIAYLAGPYTANNEYLVNKNVLFAASIAIKLWYYGFITICPHKNSENFLGGYNLTNDILLKGDIEILKRCDFVVVLPGWRNSKGTQMEIEAAKELNIPIYYWDKEEDRHYLSWFYGEGE
jgi:hypothetical protein